MLSIGLATGYLLFGQKGLETERGEKVMPLTSEVTDNKNHCFIETQ